MYICIVLHHFVKGPPYAGNIMCVYAYNLPLFKDYNVHVPGLHGYCQPQMTGGCITVGVNDKMKMYVSGLMQI